MLLDYLHNHPEAVERLLHSDELAQEMKERGDNVFAQAIITVAVGQAHQAAIVDQAIRETNEEEANDKTLDH